MTSSPDPAAAWTPLEFEEESAPATAVTRSDPGGWMPPVFEARGGAASLSRTDEEPLAASEFDNGYAKGFQEGQARGRAEIQGPAETLQRAAEALEPFRDEIVREMGRCVHALAVGVAEKIIQREVLSDPAIVAELVKKALVLIPADAAVEVRLNPEDLAALERGSSGSLLPARTGAARCVPDPSLGRGSFVIDSPLKIVNGGVESALRSLYERLEYE
jgi:flagellar biosynthesis/type III secretory pathway protein FliH